MHPGNETKHTTPNSKPEGEAAEPGNADYLPPFVASPFLFNEIICRPYKSQREQKQLQVPDLPGAHQAAVPWLWRDAGSSAETGLHLPLGA